jgi:hypothetical protein
MRVRTLLASFACLATTGLAHAVDVAGWNVQPAVVDGKVLGCMMNASYERGTQVGLMVVPGEGWFITLGNRQWSIQKGYTTNASVVVDGNEIANGRAVAIDDNFLVLQLEGTRPYVALQQGLGVRIVTDAGTVSLSLSGTYAAMEAVLTCAKTYKDVQEREASRAPPKAPPSSPSGPVAVSASEALVMATNLLAASGISGYRVDKPEGEGVTWTLGNGVKGLLLAYRNFHGEPEEAAATVMKSIASSCTGEFATAKKSVPTDNGFIVRQLIAACTNSGERTEWYISLIQQPDGLFTILSHSGAQGIAQSDRSAAAAADKGMLQAVMKPGR